MPTELLTRVNWDLIHPEFRDQCFELAAACRAKGSDYFAISGYRSYKEQAALYFQGRTKPGNIVTFAKPGESLHNFGLAVDWCLDKDQTREGLQPGWKTLDYSVLADEAVKLGIETGFRWSKKRLDPPHTQLPIYSKSVTLTMLQKAHEDGGIKAVWKLIDEHGPWFPKKEK